MPHLNVESKPHEDVPKAPPAPVVCGTGTSPAGSSAAAVMIAVFAIFASLSALDIKQLGVGLATSEPA
jgi:putative drug exporter of the RND superfamily